MKKFVIFLTSAVLATIMPSAPTHATTTNDFHFESFTADYYLSQTEDGTSHLSVAEDLVAIFPETDQNHGIIRLIPITNQDGKNFVADPNQFGISITRNGVREPNSGEIADGYIKLQIGSEDTYVHGRQEYSLAYDFTKVITEPNGDRGLQELYWDTNGTGWAQRFDTLTARIHLDAPSTDAWTGEAWCYVGTQGSSDQSRCTLQKLDASTIEFTTTSPLAPEENLTFNLTFAPSTFIVPAPPKNYTAPIVATIIGILSIALITIMLVTYAKHRTRYLDWKHTFIAPEYQPIKNLTVAEASLLSTSTPPQYSIPATLIELAVMGKIKLEETKSKILKKSKWQLHIISTAGLSTPQHNALLLVNGGKAITAGDHIEIKSRFSSHQMLLIQKAYKKDTEASLLSKKLFQKPLATNISIAPFAYMIISLIAISITSETPYGTELVARWLVAIVFLTAIPITIWSFFLAARIQKVAQRTAAGLKLERRLEGIKLFIKMAEVDRIKFFQSAKSAERINTKDGKVIIKLYEKLLPYAIIFGLEKTWSRKLEHYYVENPTIVPIWYIGTTPFSASNFSGSLHSITTSISSSSISGSGGGGFSGGGGGGGGGGGW